MKMAIPSTTVTSTAYGDLGDHQEVLPGVFDCGGDFRRFSVLLELQVSADSPQQANDRAMRWRDKVASHDGLVLGVDFDWHLHGPDGC